MVDLNDFIIKDKHKWYKCTCDKCGIDRGYKRLTKAKMLCHKCSCDKHKVLKKYDNVDYNDFIVKKTKSGDRIRYRHRCCVCGKDKGYMGNNQATQPCRSCQGKIRNANMDEKTKEMMAIRVSCGHRNIDMQEFDGFTNKKTSRDRQVFKNMGLSKICFQKQNYTCDICGKYGVRLNAHHMDSWNEFPELRFDIGNLVCLCTSCHKDFHKRFGNRKNTKTQYMLFKSTYIKS